MEEIIYTEAIARLKSDDAVAYYTAKEVDAPKTYEWFQNQIEQALANISEENRTAPFDCPALFFQFEPTEYSKGNTSSQEAEGTLIVHLAQFTFVDGRDGAATHLDFKKLLRYADIIIDLLTGSKLPCSAKLILAKVERDHTNRPIMTDKIHLSWSGQRRRAIVPAV